MKSALEDQTDHDGRRKARKSAHPAPPPPAPLLDEQFRVFELAYGSGATLVLTAHTGGPFAQQKFVTLIAQPDLYGNLLVLLKNVTDGAHLDETPRMKLVDAVDAMADNRGELLFELRGADPAPVRPLPRAARPGGKAVSSAAAASSAQVELWHAEKVATLVTVTEAPNGIHYAAWGETRVSEPDLDRLVGAVPATLSAALSNRAYYFVPLAIADTGETMIAPATPSIWATAPSATATRPSDDRGGLSLHAAGRGPLRPGL
jgi:hypothetical protein